MSYFVEYVTDQGTIVMKSDVVPDVCDTIFLSFNGDTHREHRVTSVRVIADPRYLNWCQVEAEVVVAKEPITIKPWIVIDKRTGRLLGEFDTRTEAVAYADSIDRGLAICRLI